MPVDAITSSDERAVNGNMDNVEGQDVYFLET
jgi:hypothetical protein